MVDFHTDLLERTLNTNREDQREWRRAKLEAETSGVDALDLNDDARELMNTDEFSAAKSTAFDKPKPYKEPVRLFKLHGNMSQKDRADVFKSFKASEAGVLVCTDVAARGLDLPAVDWIVQYNPPTTKADYVHRVGRTARIGTKGSSVIFLLPSEAKFVRELESENLLLAEMTLEQVLQKLYQNIEENALTGKRPHSLEEAATELQMKMENSILEDKELHASACQAYVSYIRSYASYPREAREVFCFKDLHLGHIAKSYALRDPPTKITGIGKGQWVGNDSRKRDRERKEAVRKEEKVIRAQQRRVDQKSLVMSEYSSGLDGIEAREKADRGRVKEDRKKYKTKQKSMKKKK